MLFFGFTLEDITYAAVEIQSDGLCIVLRTKPRTKGRRFYHRDQVLKLPSNAKWFMELQKRFYASWLKLHSKTKKTYPHPSLVLPKHAHYNRPLSKNLIRERIYAATTYATGTLISPRILRQTCGHLYSQNQDASILSRMGWSPQFAFHYTWLPRKLLPENPLPKKPKRNFHFTK